MADGSRQADSGGQGDIFQRLLDHFQGFADALDDQALARSLFPEAAAGGLFRPEILERFLTRHLPNRCQVISQARIFDSTGAVSVPVDLAVTGDLCIRLAHPDGSFHCLEGCHAAVVVEERLDRDAVFDALGRLASVPLSPEVPPGLEFVFGPRTQGILHKAVFAFEGTDPDTTLADVEAYYAANPVADKARPNLIIVNNSYGIMRTGEQGAATTGGMQIPPNTFHTYACVPHESCVGGYSLMLLLTEIQKAIASGSQAAIDYGDYLDQLPL